jgi:hypothetical protein
MTFIFNAVVVIFSLCAGAFWMASATGRTLPHPWKPWESSQPVPLVDLPNHQSYWNARAALCASIAAIAQALLFLYSYYWIQLMPN